MLVFKGKYIHINYLESTPSGKTNIYEVMTEDNVTFLGTIQWNAHWRRYWFLPETHTGYESICLRDIATFLEQTMEEHKKAKRVTA